MILRRSDQIARLAAQIRDKINPTILSYLILAAHGTIWVRTRQRFVLGCAILGCLRHSLQSCGAQPLTARASANTSASARPTLSQLAPRARVRGFCVPYLPQTYPHHTTMFAGWSNTDRYREHSVLEEKTHGLTSQPLTRSPVRDPKVRPTRPQGPTYAVISPVLLPH